MTYQLIVKPGAQHQLRQLDPPVLRRIMRKLQQLQQNPRPPDAQKLHGRLAGYRARVGDWRILYQIDDQTKEVRVYRIKHRSRAYRRYLRHYESKHCSRHRSQPRQVYTR